MIILEVGFDYLYMKKNNQGFKLAMLALAGFVLLLTDSFIQANYREQLIVYNVPQKQAIDLINGRKYSFIGDTGLLTDDFVKNFYLNPSRVLHRIEPTPDFYDFLQQKDVIIHKNKKILVINRTRSFPLLKNKIPVDLLLISGNPKLYI